MADLAVACAEGTRRQSRSTIGQSLILSASPAVEGIRLSESAAAYRDSGATILWETSFTDAQGWTQDIYQKPYGPGFLNVQSGTADHGSWYVTPNYDGVITGANRSGGAGGRGFRHWRGDGFDSDGGGMNINLPGRIRECWMRYYIRYAAGYHWQDPNTPSNPHFAKDIYWQPQEASGKFTFGHNGAGWGFWLVDGGSANISTAGKDWYWMNGNSYYADGNWHCFEFHIKAETTQGGSDAIGEVWVDNVLCVSRNDISYGITLSSNDWNYLTVGENADSPQNGSPQPIDFDDIAFSTTGRIGP